MKHINFKINWLELIIAIFLGTYFGYIFLAFVTDIRIDRLRTFITNHAIDEGVKAGALEYERKYLIDEHEAFRKRKVRDQKIREYIRRLDDMMSVEK